MISQSELKTHSPLAIAVHQELMQVNYCPLEWGRMCDVEKSQIWVIKKVPGE